MRRLFVGVLLLSLGLPLYASKDLPFQTITYPDGGTPVLRLTFSKFKTLVGGIGKEHTYITDTTAENLSDRVLNSVNLTLYVFDKTHARIGDGSINLTNVGPGEVVKFQITLYASGVPASVTAVGAAPRSGTVSVTINSVPQGAVFKLDGKEIGTTPKLVDVNLGKHMIEFSKEGYNTGQFPFEMGPRDANGGSVSYELGTSAHDTIELRDGSVLSGDLLSLDATQVQVRIGGNIQTYERNQIKRLLLTQRDPVEH
jgi:PEGA domain